jgi:hypothetical protein
MYLAKVCLLQQKTVAEALDDDHVDVDVDQNDQMVANACNARFDDKALENMAICLFESMQRVKRQKLTDNLILICLIMR